LDVGLSYLTLNRASNTLSGGESQRINLATSLGSSLVGSMYILDEPSIGLHSKDTERLISVLQKLRDLGNTVIVVEHDEDIMNDSYQDIKHAADYIIDNRPQSATNPRDIVLKENYDELLKAKTLNDEYMHGKLEIDVQKKRNPFNHYNEVKGARENKLKNIA